jgi:hypothetical protein
MAKKKRSDEEVLFPEITIDDTTVKPWGFGALFELSDSLEKILDKVEEKKLAEEIESGFLTNITLARLFTIANKEVLRIIAYTVKCDEDEVKDWDMDKGIKVATVIFNQNKETITGALKNALGSPTKEKTTKKSKKDGERKS